MTYALLPRAAGVAARPAPARPSVAASFARQDPVPRHRAGATAHGHFVCDASLRALTCAPWFAAAGHRTPVMLSIRCCGEPAPADTVRGAFAFDVLFQASAADAGAAWRLPACSLPLCLHGRRPEPWRDGEPLAPWLWLMSDRALPRSWRMMQGFGTRTWRLSPAAGGTPVFARFHWLPAAGTHALAADEAEQLAAADPQFLRHDLRDALAAQSAPAWTLAVQVFSERQAALHGIDPNDPGPLLPHDWAPLRNVGRLVLESLAEAGGPDPVEADARGDAQSDAQADVQSDAQSDAQSGAEPDDEAGAPGLEPCPPPTPRWPDDDLLQARLFWRSQSGAEQRHLAEACRAAGAALHDAAARERLRRRLAQVDPALAGPAPSRHAAAGAIVLPVLRDEVDPLRPARPPAPAARAGAPAATPLPPLPPLPSDEPAPAPMLSLWARPGERSVRLRRVALLLADGVEPASLRALQRALRLAGARPQRVGLQPGAFRAEGGGLMLAEASVQASPSVLWDAVVLPAGAVAQAALARSPEAVRFVQEQYRHGKPILQLGPDLGLLARLGLPPVLPDGRSDPALLRSVDGGSEPGRRRLLRAFLEALALPRRFDRGPACLPRLGPSVPVAAVAAGAAPAMPTAPLRGAGAGA